jgi:hypothetical protein
MNRKWIVTGLALLMLTRVGAIAQNQQTPARPQILVNLAQPSEGGGYVEVIQPVQVENLLTTQLANNRLQRGIHGYRIRIFSQSGQTARQKAEVTRKEVMKNFPDMEAHWEYNTPNFQIFVGDFRTKNEALREMKMIEKLFPGAFIVSDIIKMPE